MRRALEALQITEANETSFAIFCQNFAQKFLRNQNLLKFPGIPDRELRLPQFPWIPDGVLDEKDLFWRHSMLVKQSSSFSSEHRTLSVQICVRQTVWLTTEFVDWCRNVCTLYNHLSATPAAVTSDLKQRLIDTWGNISQKRHRRSSWSTEKAVSVSFPVPNGMEIFRRGPPNGGIECKGVWKNHDFRPVSCFILQMMRDRAIVTMEGE